MAISGLWSRVERFCLNPALFDDAGELARARLMLMTCTVYSAMFIPLMLYSTAERPEFLSQQTIVMVGHALVMSCAVLLRFFRTTTIPVGVVTVIATAQVVCAAILTGGPSSVVLYSFPLAPLFFGLLGRPVHGITSTVGLVTGLGLIYVLEREGFDFGTGGPTLIVQGMVLTATILTGLGMGTYAVLLNRRINALLMEELQQRNEAEHEAKEAREARDWFIAYLSHEMRSPLSVIAGGVDLLQHADDQLDRDRQIGVLRSASAGMVRLMDDVLDISALSRGHVSLVVEEVDVCELSGALYGEFKEAARRKGLALALEAPEEPVLVMGDTQRLRQILTNLVDNAVKFTTAGGVSLSVEVQEGAVRVQVSDTGPGVASADIARIFEPYSRVGNEGVRGTGLGLAIASMLVGQMGSQLFIESTLGDGSTFWFDLVVST